MAMLPQELKRRKTIGNPRAETLPKAGLKPMVQPAPKTAPTKSLSEMATRKESWQDIATGAKRKAFKGAKRMNPNYSME